MDGQLFERLMSFCRSGAAAIGIPESCVVGRDGTVALVGTGVEIWWRESALGQNSPGWQVRETFLREDLLEDDDRTTTEVVGNFRPEDIFRAVRIAVIRAAVHRVDAALDQIKE